MYARPAPALLPHHTIHKSQRKTGGAHAYTKRTEAITLPLIGPLEVIDIYALLPATSGSRLLLSCSVGSLAAPAHEPGSGAIGIVAISVSST